MGEEHSSGEGLTIHRNHQALFYFGEGAIAGLVFYFLVVLLVAIVPMLSSDGLLAAVVALFLIALIPKIVGLTAARRNLKHSPTVQAWQETRQWRWVGIMGLLTGGVLIAGSVLAWQWEWPIRDATIVMMGVLLSGGFIRALGMYRSEQMRNST